MPLEMKMEHRLTQTLKITPQLTQAIKLLQLNHLDLIEQLHEEMLENPTLMESVDDGPDIDLLDRMRDLTQRGMDANQDALEQQNGSVQADSNLAGLDDPNRPNKAQESLSDEVWSRILEEAGSYNPRGASGGGIAGEDLPPIEASLSTSPSLYEHLAWQLRMQSCTDAERIAAEIMLHNLDSNGFLAITLEEVAETAGVDMDDVEGAQEIVQGLDPTGCGARDLVECLLYQAKHLYPEDPFFPEIISEHLEDLQRRNYQRIADAMDMDLEDVHEYHRMLQQEFNPRPGSGYNDSEPQYVTADVEVFKVGDKWEVRLNEDGLPKLRISPYYLRVLESGSPEEKKYIKQKLESADFLLRSIYRRQSTIQKVVESILERQSEFFEHGVAFLKPMVLREVAEQIGVHESTVSRVTSSKYLQCPQGLLELKYFFDSGVRGSQGVDVASSAVKHIIKQLVDGEDRKNPLSDQDIVDSLGKRGVKCARRTVAKYRDELQILPSSRRKQVF